MGVRDDQPDGLGVIPAIEQAIVVRPDGFEPMRRRVDGFQRDLASFPWAELSRPRAEPGATAGAEPEKPTVAPESGTVAIDRARHRNLGRAPHSGLLRGERAAQTEPNGEGADDAKSEIAQGHVRRVTWGRHGRFIFRADRSRRTAAIRNSARLCSRRWMAITVSARVP